MREEDDGYGGGAVLTPAALLAEKVAERGDAALAVVVGAADFAAARESVTPSVSPDEMVYYEEIRKRFSPDAKT